MIEKIKLNINSKAAFKGKNATYQTILYKNVQELANFLIGKGKGLNFVMPTLMIKRNDNLDVQQRILTISQAERKALGISKSGLWYQKKKLAEGKTIKAYAKTLYKYSELFPKSACDAKVLPC